MPLSINVNSIPLKDMRYATLGDYFGTVDRRTVLVAELNDRHKEFLIFIHEAIEQHLCFMAGVSERDIKAFDEEFELETKKGLHSPDDEPGNDPRAPYFHEHQLATKLEKMLCEEGMKMDWDRYMKSIYEVFENAFYKEGE